MTTATTTMMEHLNFGKPTTSSLILMEVQSVDKNFMVDENITFDEKNNFRLIFPLSLILYIRRFHSDTAIGMSIGSVLTWTPEAVAYPAGAAGILSDPWDLSDIIDFGKSVAFFIQLSKLFTWYPNFILNSYRGFRRYAVGIGEFVSFFRNTNQTLRKLFMPLALKVLVCFVRLPPAFLAFFDRFEKSCSGHTMNLHLQLQRLRLC